MNASSARRPMDIGPTRRERRVREQTRAQLERVATLEAEAREQGGRRLGPAGQPVGAAARAGWARRQVNAYLALPPWRRAWLTWQSWGRLRRAVLVLGLACVWTVLVLPLRMLGLATLDVSQLGVAVLAGLAPVAAFVPLARRGRFERELPPPGPPWRSSRVAVRIRRVIVVAGALAIGGFALAAWLGGVSTPDRGIATSSAARADRVVVERVVAQACPDARIERVRRVGSDTYSATLAGGDSARVKIDFPGRSPVGAGAGHGVLLEPAPSCAEGGS